MRRKESNFIFEEVLETTGNREMELGFDISRVGEKKMKIGECSPLPTQKISYPSSI